MRTNYKNKATNTHTHAHTLSTKQKRLANLHTQKLSTQFLIGRFAYHVMKRVCHCGNWDAMAFTYRDMWRAFHKYICSGPPLGKSRGLWWPWRVPRRREKADIGTRCRWSEPISVPDVADREFFIYLFFYLLMLYGKGQRSASNLCLQPNTQNVQLY